jgi:hypothetical protein
MRAYFLLWLIFQPALCAREIVKLGERTTLLENGQYGLKYFPDGGIAVLQGPPAYRVLLAGGISSYLLEGQEMISLRLVKQVLEPGPKGSFDNGYAGIYGAWRDPQTGEIRAIYHAEDQEDMNRLPNGVHGFYASVGLAISADQGSTFRKAGRILTGHQPKNAAGRPDQGCGEPSLLPDQGGHFLYCYYTDHTRLDNRGVQIGLARSPIADKAAPGTWLKYYEGTFSEPGLGGKETPVVDARPAADALFPNVTYSKALGKYVMVFNILYYADLREGQAAKGGIHAAFSADLIHWSNPQLLVQGLSIALLDREVLWHPAIVWDDEAQSHGWLVYSYSPRWGHRGLRTPHYMVGHRITFSRGE